MIVEYIRYTVPQDRAAEFLAAYAEAAPTLEADPHCLAYEVTQGTEDPTHFVVRIQWDSVEGHLAGFRNSPAFGTFFAAVRPFVDQIEEMSHFGLHRAWSRTPSAPPTLYEWAGGTDAFRRLIDAFYDRVELDDLLSPLFPGGVGEEHRARVSTWWCEVFGGPAGYTEQLGGYERMLAHHRGLGITTEMRRRFAYLMSLAADDAKLPDDAEFRAAFVGYVEWGTRLALHNSQPSVATVEHAPVPHWGWGVAPPFQG